MEKFTVYTGTTVPLMNDNIDTDQILPKQFLKLIDKKGFGKYLMYAWRYLDDQYTENPDFVFNRPEYRKASIAKPVFSSQEIILGLVLRGNTQLGH